MTSQPTDIDQPSGSGESKTPTDDQYSEEVTARRRDEVVRRRRNPYRWLKSKEATALHHERTTGGMAESRVVTGLVGLQTLSAAGEPIGGRRPGPAIMCFLAPTTAALGVRPTSTKPSRSYLSEVVSEIEDGFIVSVSTVSATHDIEIVGEETTATLEAADLYIEQFARTLKYATKDVRKLYNLVSGIKAVP